MYFIISFQIKTKQIKLQLNPMIIFINKRPILKKFNYKHLNFYQTVNGDFVRNEYLIVYIWLQNSRVTLVRPQFFFEKSEEKLCQY